MSSFNSFFCEKSATIKDNWAVVFISIRSYVLKQMINLVIKDIIKYISNKILSGNMFGSIDIYDFFV